MFVIKFNDKYYWCGYNHADTQLRKAVIYKSEKMAKEIAEDCLKRSHFFTSIQSLEEPVSYKIVEIEIREK